MLWNEHPNVFTVLLIVFSLGFNTTNEADKGIKTNKSELIYIYIVIYMYICIYIYMGLNMYIYVHIVVSCPQ